MGDTEGITRNQNKKAYQQTKTKCKNRGGKERAAYQIPTAEEICADASEGSSDKIGEKDDRRNKKQFKQK